jgi:5'-nucleotidase
MKLLLTNDDGIDAPGLRALAEAAEGIGEVIVVAPASARSGCGHSTTTDRPLRFTRLDKNLYAVDGTPADCVRVSLHRFAGEIGWVLAGINCGANLGVDVYHSGTVGAVREAAIRGFPAIAISHYRNRKLTEADWKRAAGWTRWLLDDLMSRREETGTYWNINFPILGPGEPRPEAVFCPLDPSPLPLGYEENGETFLYSGVYSERRRVQGGDVDTCFAGKIAISLVSAMETSR